MGKYWAREDAEYSIWVEAHPTIENGNTIDAGEGPGHVIAQIVERFFTPPAIPGNPSRRQIFMVVNLDTPAQMAELMYVLTWFTSDQLNFRRLRWALRYMPTRLQTRSAFCRRRRRHLCYHIGQACR